MFKKICFSTNLIYFIVLCAFVVLRICTACGVFSFLGNWAGVVLSFITQIGIIFLLPLVLFKCFNKMKFKETMHFYGFKKTSHKVILVSFVLGAVVFALNIYVSSFFNGVIQFFGYKPKGGSEIGLPNTWWVFLLELITTAVLPAICEETLHRGMLLNGNSQFGIKKAVLISGILFGLLHLNIEQFFYASIIGLFLGYLALGCNSIYPCIIVHFMNNGLSVFLSFAKTQGWAIGNMLESISQFLIKSGFLGFVIFILVFVLLLVFAYELTNWLIKKSFHFNFGKKEQEFANKTLRQNFLRQIDDIKNDNSGGKSILQDGRAVIRVDMKDFMEFITNGLKEDPKGLLSDKFAQADDVKKIKNVELKTKILIYGSFVLSALVTIMSFIWGLLR